MKFCVNCVHCKFNNDKYYCTHDSVERLDPVTGITYRLTTHTCTELRADTSGPRCGIYAKHYEDRRWYVRLWNRMFK